MENQIAVVRPEVFQMICAKASKIQLIEHFTNMSIAQIVKGNYPTIGALIGQYGKEPVDTAIAIIVSDLNTTYSGVLSQEDIQEVVAEVSSNFYTRNITMEGLYMICSKLKRTTFKLSVPSLLKAVLEHQEEQQKAYMQANYNAHLQTKFNAPRLSDQMKESDGAYREALIEYTKKSASKP